MYAFKKQMGGPGFFANAHPDDFATRPVDAKRPIKVVVMGAGMSGIIAGILFPRSIENMELVIYDKNPDIGGTWFENVYPGIACDIPAHAYQFTFENNPTWSSYYAPGSEIHAYLKRVATKYDAYKYMKFRNRCNKAEWNDAEGKWYIDMEDLEAGKKFTDTADVFISAVGCLNEWKWPDVPGLHDFKGKLSHSASYDRSYDITGKRVALIGGGSSSIQILPKIQPHVKHATLFMKSRTWIPPAGIGGEGLQSRGGNPVTPAEDLELFKKDPKAYLEYRRMVENILHRPVEALYQNTGGAQMLFQMCYDHMKKKLAKKPEIFEQMVPDFPPGCKRLTPGPGFLEALVEDNVDFVSTGIKQVHADHIETNDGQKIHVDMIICATGFDGVYKQHYPVIGKEGVNLQDLWKKIPEAYMAIASEKMPNYFMFLGPNGGPGLGSAVPFLENEGKYMIKVIQKIQREYIKSMIPKKELITQFGNYLDGYFSPTIFAATCNAWWKHNRDPNGRLLAIWPGSQLHGSYAFESPRWEDFEYEIRPELKGNPLAWLGNGLTKGQIVGEHTTDYLDTAYVPVENPIEAEQRKNLAKEKLNGVADEAVKHTDEAVKHPDTVVVHLEVLA